MAGKQKTDEKRPIVIKKSKRSGEGHHGGSWKVAYADFVTAMMAFFLLMWLLNSTSAEQREGIAEYFEPTPMEVSSNQSGAGGVMGGLTVTSEGSMVSKASPMDPSTAPPTLPKSAEELSKEQLEAEIKAREDKAFEDVKKEIEAKIQESELKDFAKNLKVDMTPEGLRIQIVDQDGESMFPSGSAAPFEKTTKLLSMVAQIIKTMPNQISIRGHTDGAQYSKGANYTNWELSAERANASRRVLLQSGIDPKKVSNVVGKADTENLNVKNPLDPQNRRISVVLLRESLTKQSGTVNSTNNAPADPGYRRTQGNVQFP
jgi:chemotaxis protein MotB